MAKFYLSVPEEKYMNRFCSVTANSGVASMENSRKSTWIVLVSLNICNKQNKKITKVLQRKTVLKVKSK